MQMCFPQASLEKLMGMIEKAEPFFIFCIRSNREKVKSLCDCVIPPSCGKNNIAPYLMFTSLQKELHFDDELVLQQIKHTGILQVVHIQKSGYTAKYSFKVCSHTVNNNSNNNKEIEIFSVCLFWSNLLYGRKSSQSSECCFRRGQQKLQRSSRSSSRGLRWRRATIKLEKLR